MLATAFASTKIHIYYRTYGSKICQDILNKLKPIYLKHQSNYYKLTVKQNDAFIQYNTL